MRSTARLAFIVRYGLPAVDATTCTRIAQKSVETIHGPESVAATDQRQIGKP